MLTASTAFALNISLPREDHRPLLLIYAVAAGLSAWVGGFMPGLVTTLLGAGASAFLLARFDHFRFGLYVISSICLVWLIAELHAARVAVLRRDEHFRRAQRSARMSAFEWHLATGEVIWSEEMPVLQALGPGKKTYDFDDVIEVFPGEMRQVFSNLVSNAIEALPPGGCVRLHVCPSRGWHSGQEGVRVVVADTVRVLRRKTGATFLSRSSPRKANAEPGSACGSAAALFKNTEAASPCAAPLGRAAAGLPFPYFCPAPARYAREQPRERPKPLALQLCSCVRCGRVRVRSASRFRFLRACFLPIRLVPLREGLA